MSALDLLSGDARAFCEKVWASRVHVHESDPGPLVAMLSLDDVDELLTSVALRTPALRVAQDGAVLPASRYTRSAAIAGTPMTGLVDGRKVLDLFDAGATVVLQGLHRYWQPLTELVRVLERELGHPCQANAYLTPPGSQGFARHSDRHDVFVFQTHGHKRWSVWEPVPGDPGAERVEHEVVLEPGLSMYLPAGTPHAARSQAETSLHVTLGVNQVSGRDLLRAVTDRLLEGQEYAAALPAGYLDSPATLERAVSGLVERLRDDLAGVRTEEVVAERVTTFLTDRAPALRGGLTDRVSLAALDDQTALGRRPGSVCELRVDADRLRVLLGDRELRMPSRLEPVMAFVRDRESLRVADLAPWLDETSRVVVARRLVREGLLRVLT